MNIYIHASLIEECRKGNSKAQFRRIKKKKIDLTPCETLPESIYEEDEDVIYDTGKIFKCIEMLPNGYRIILTLYLLEGYDHSEISQILSISES